MVPATSLAIELLPGARALLSEHARELPQRDDLCGAFCGALALRAAGIEQHDGAQLDQDTVAMLAGSVVSQAREQGVLPFGERGRRDYRLEVPLTDDAERSGTTVAGLMAALGQLAAPGYEVIAFSGPWTAGTIEGLFEAAVAASSPTALLANFATRHLWGSRARVDQLLDYLEDGRGQGPGEGPAADWDVGHFACIVGRVRGTAGALYAIADTYPSLGAGGVHLQPRERLAAALDRGGAGGGVLALSAAAEAGTLRERALVAGLREGAWDNGSVPAELLA